MHLVVAEMLLDYLDFSLKIDPLSSEEYFTLLTQLLTQSSSLTEDLNQFPGGLLVDNITIPSNKKETKTEPISEETKRHFTQVFSKIDGELVKLFEIEKAKRTLG